MKVTIDKAYIQEYQIERVKADAKEFGRIYNPQMLYITFKQATDLQTFNPDIVKCEVKAFDRGTLFNEETLFEVNMMLDDRSRIYKIHFYCDLGLTVNTETLHDGTRMYQILEYRLK